MTKGATSWLFFALALGVIVYQVFVHSEHIDWNEEDITWHGYQEGIEKARAMNRPSLIVIYGEWCGYCKQYAKVFNDAGVAQAMRDVIAIKIDVDDPERWAHRNGLDGSGVPRTFALDSNGDFIRHPQQPSRNHFISWTGDRAWMIRFINYVANT
jgi:thiol:disulfide interchange protein